MLFGLPRHGGRVREFASVPCASHGSRRRSVPPLADVIVKKYRVPVHRARECAIATAQAETAGIAPRCLAALPPRWNRRSVISLEAQRSAAAALACPSSLTPCLPPLSAFLRWNHSGRVVGKHSSASAGELPDIEPSGNGVFQLINRTAPPEANARRHGH